MRKAFGIILAAAMVLVCVLLLSGGRPEQSASQTYTITVNGGHAISQHGNTITSALPGTWVFLVPDQEPGTYVKEWKSGQVSYFEFGQRFPNSTCEGHYYYHFYMPECPVTIDAVTAKQTPYTIDMTSGSFELPEENSDLEWFDWLSQALGTRDYYADEFRYDVDGDGTTDMFSVNPSRYVEWLGRVFIPAHGRSAEGTITLDRENYGPYWPFIIQFGEEPDKETYTIKVVGGHAESLTGNVITEAKAGQYIVLKPDVIEGMAVCEWKTQDGSIIQGVSPEADTLLSKFSFPMPAKDQTYIAVEEPLKAYVIDMSKGYATVPADHWDRDFCLFKYDYSSQKVDYKLDLDGDGTIDICSSDEDYPVIFPTATRSVDGIYILSPAHYEEYNGLEFRFPEKAEDYAITVNGGHAEDDAGNVITRVAPGTMVTVCSDGGPGKYWKAWNTDYEVIKRAGIQVSFAMPACDVTFTAVTTETQKPLTLDLTNEIRMSEDEVFQILQTFRELYIERRQPLHENYKNPFRNYYLDIDGNGSTDIELCFSEDYHMGKVTGIGRGYEYSLGEKTTIEVSDGPFGPVTFIVNNEKSGYWPLENLGTCHKITILEGDSVRVRYGQEGSKIVVASLPRADGYYVSEWTIDGVEEWDTSFCDLEFIMPDHDITVKGTLSETTPLVIDLSRGYYSEFLDSEFYYWFYYLKKYLNLPINVGYMIDLNGDGEGDVWFETDKIKVAYPYTCGPEYTLPGGTTGPYYPIVFIYEPNKPEPKPTATPTPEPKPTNTPTVAPTEAPVITPTPIAPEKGEDSAHWIIWLTLIGVCVFGSITAGFLINRKRKAKDSAGVETEEAKPEESKEKPEEPQQ